MPDSKEASIIEEQMKQSDAELAELEKQVAAKKAENKAIKEARASSVGEFRKDLERFARLYMGDTLGLGPSREMGALSSVFIEDKYRWKDNHSDDAVVHVFRPAFVFKFDEYGRAENDIDRYYSRNPSGSFVVEGDPNYDALVKTIVGDGTVLKIGGRYVRGLDLVCIFCFFFRQNGDVEESVHELAELINGRENFDNIINTTLYDLYLKQQS